MSSVPSIKKNFALNMIYTVSGILFPLITFPYASRILLADGIGHMYFFSVIIDYISLLTSLGIPLYAIREIARVRENQAVMSKTATEILILHTILSGFGYLIVFLLICSIGQIQADIPLFLLLSTSILFKAIGVEWFYNGVEDFKYITVRSIIVRLLSLAALFIFVKEKDDLFIYAAISVTGTVGSNVFNFFRLRKYVDTGCFGIKDLQVWRHFKPALKIFTLNLIISLYVNLDSIMLGFMKEDDTAVGYYTAATRISKTLVGVVTSLGTVLLPRLSHLAGNNKMDEFKSLSAKSINFIIAFSLPLTIGVIFMASPIIHLFCGKDFEPSILTLQIMAPIVLLIPLSGIYSMQILYALGKEKLSIIAVSFGAITNFTLNLFLIPGYAQYGAGVATVIAEFLVTFSAILLGRKYVSFRIFSKEKVHYYIASLLIIVMLYFQRFSGMGEILYLITGTIEAVVLYIGYLAIVKDETLIRVATLIRNKINSR